MRLRRLNSLLLAIVVALALAAVAAVVASGDAPGPTVAFDFEPAAPLTGDTVTFTSTSTAGPSRTIVSEDWDLNGDGIFGDASGSSVQWSYPTANTYHVSLQVTDDHGDFNVLSQDVTVADRPPTAGFTISPNPAMTGDTVSFDASASSDPDGSIAKYEWDLDGNSSNGFETDSGSSPTVSHSYSSSGPVTVRLKVTDDSGSSTETSNQLDVQNRAPTASFTADPNPALTGQTVSFDASASSDPDGSIAKYEWDLDGNAGNGFELDSGTDPTVQHSYADNGPVTVRVRVTDNNGATAQTSKDLTITDRAPTAALTVSPNPALIGQTVSFDASGSSDADGSIAKYEWDLDGNAGNGFELDSGTDPTVQHAYAGRGPVTVRVRVTDDDGSSDVATKSLVVDAPPVASFTASPNPALTGQNISFDASASSAPDGTITDYKWDLNGNGTFETDRGPQPTVSQSYANNGPVTVKLRVTDSNGAFSDTTKTVTINDRPPTSSFTIDPNPASTGQPVNFDGSASSDPDGSIVKYEWDIDGNATNGFELDTGVVDHTSRSYATGGSKTVRLRVTDDDGNTHISSQTVTISNQGPAASFTVSPNPAQSGQMVNFDATGSSDPDGNITSYEWDLDGNGSLETDSGADPTISHLYATAQTITVKLRVTDDNGKTAQATKSLTITNRPPTAAFSISPNPALTGHSVTLDASASTDPEGPIASYAWDLDHNGVFDDASGKTVQTAFPNAGSHVIGLRVTDGNGVSDDVTKTLDVQAPPVAAFTFSPNPALRNQTVNFDASGSTDLDGTIAKYEWDLDGNGSFETDRGTSPTVSKTYSTQDPSVDVKLRVTDNEGNTDEVTHTLTVNSRPVTASFVVSPPAPLTGDAVTFTGAGQPTGSDNAIVDYQWDLDGDGLYETDTLGTPSVSRSYPVPATIKVRLQVTDSFGNLGFAPVQFLTIGDRPPVPSFGFAPGTPFAGETVNFFSTSSDPDSAIVDQSWDLDGDGNFGDATGPSVTRSFASPGSYTVSLQVRDAEGSIQTTTQTVVVSAPPQVNQSSPRVSLLSPFPIVRISGAIKRRGTKLRRFSITAPIGSTVTVRCKGRGCPFRRQTRTARAPAKGGTAATRLIRIRPLEGRLLRAGIVVKVFVTKPGTIGKFTQFKMKKQRPPARVDKCLTANGSTPVECPVS